MRKNKYNNKKTIIDGIQFDSKKEANRYWQLRMLERSGAIAQLELQPRYPIIINGEKICTYVADFRYFDLKLGKEVVEDVKGIQTAIFKLKKKLMKVVRGIDVLIT